MTVLSEADTSVLANDTAQTATKKKAQLIFHILTLHFLASM